MMWKQNHLLSDNIPMRPSLMKKVFCLSYLQRILYVFLYVHPVLMFYKIRISKDHTLFYIFQKLIFRQSLIFFPILLLFLFLRRL